MPFDLAVAGRTHTVAVARDGERFIVTVDGRSWPVDAVRVAPGTLSLIVEGIRGRESFEVTVATDPRTGDLSVQVGANTVVVGRNGRQRSSRKDGDGPHSGPQQVVAGMPGKIVKVLVSAGDQVRAGQGLVVIEAMKMENELRAARDGRVAEVRAREAMSVEAGAVLVVIE
jgi:biotin carboxyl carrier protein